MKKVFVLVSSLAFFCCLFTVPTKAGNTVYICSGSSSNSEITVSAMSATELLSGIVRYTYSYNAHPAWHMGVHVYGPVYYNAHSMEVNYALFEVGGTFSIDKSIHVSMTNCYYSDVGPFSLEISK